MTVPKSIKTSKPKKPHKDFPLTPSSNGSWVKKINGKLYTFGRWANDHDGQKALAKYTSQKDAILLRNPKRVPEVGPTDLTLKQAINHFLCAQNQALSLGEITARHFNDCLNTSRMIVGYFNPKTGETVHETVIDPSKHVSALTGDDFRKIRHRFGTKKDGTPAAPATLKQHIIRARSIFKFAYEERLIDRPVLYGKSFDVPNKKQLRIAKKNAGDKTYQPSELKAILKEAGPAMKAMCLLGINAAMGNTDVALLKLSEIDLDNRLVKTMRQKTAIDRTAFLWKETVDAIRDYVSVRPDPRDDAHSDYVFITQKPRALWDSQTAVTNEFRKLREKAGVEGRKRNFYSLRHTFNTVAENVCGDQTAIRMVMGHSDNSMSNEYRHFIHAERIEQVCLSVHRWLFNSD